ncbi:MAG TPA: hypothetical protein VJZ71_06240 [Phycisphaerae bacterium]|nr:hypothetical protein [Phycisphaerae bacterium]
MRSSIITIAAATACLFTARLAFGQFEIDWHSIDAGGTTAPNASTGGSFAVAGTIGQPDAGPATGPMIGGTFEVRGGFWLVPLACHCPGDMNGDNTKDGLDVQKLVACLTASGGCTCADVDAVSGVTLDDVTVFVDDLLTGGVCPK